MLYNLYKIMKIAIGFYGITRSLKYTIGSINKKFLISLKSYINVRTGENILDSTKIDNESTSY